MPIANDPALIAEVAALHDVYERALIANDVEALTRFFWDSPAVTRYGVVEHLYGAEAIKTYRKGNAPLSTDRKVVRRQIATFGSDWATVMCEITQVTHGKPGHVRQSQTWVRFPDAGWRIVAAHVSIAQPPPQTEWAAYADRVAAALALPLDPAHRPGVVQNLERTAAIAAPLLAHPLPAGIESPAIFVP